MASLRVVVEAALLMFLLSTLAGAQVQSFDCGRFREADLIVLVDSTELDVKSIDYISDANLPSDWMIKSQGRAGDDEMSTIIRSLGMYSDYSRAKFSGAFKQYIMGPDEEVYVRIERFNDSHKLGQLFVKLKTKYNQASNVVGYTGNIKYGSGFKAKLIISGENDQYRIIFRKGNSLIFVYSENEDACEVVAEACSDFRGDIAISGDYQKQYLVCKSHTESCNLKISVDTNYDTIKINQCRVLHAGGWVDCKKSRIRKYVYYQEIPFPSCEKGDLLFLDYEKESSLPIRNRIWGKIYVNRTNPVKNLSIRLSVPAEIELEYLSNRWVEPIETSEDNMDTYLWTSTRIPPYEYEPYMPEKDEVISWLAYTSIKSWDEVEDWLGDLFRESLEPDLVKTKTDEITKTDKNVKEKVDSIYHWVRNNIRYEPSELGLLTGFKPHPASEVLNQRMGDCKDHSILMLSMLENIGVKAHPVLVTHPLYVESIPSLYSFDHAIVLIDDGSEFRWLDPTCSYCPPGYLAPDFQERPVMILFDDEKGFSEISPYKKDEIQLIERNYTMMLGADGSAIMEVLVREVGKWAHMDSHEVEENSKEGVEKSFSYTITGLCEDGDLESYNVLGYEPEKSEYRISLKIQCTDFAAKSGENLVITPSTGTFMSETFEEEERSYPVVFKKSEERTYLKRIKLPEGYSPYSLPEDYVDEKPFGKASIKYSKSEDYLEIHESIELKEGTVDQGDYITLKIFLKDYNIASKREIVLKRESEMAGVSVTTTTVPEIREVKKIETKEEKEGETPAPKETTGNRLYLLVGGGLVLLVLILFLRKK
jgi:hypothetical protein